MFIRSGLNLAHPNDILAQSKIKQQCRSQVSLKSKKRMFVSRRCFFLL